MKLKPGKNKLFRAEKNREMKEKGTCAWVPLEKKTKTNINVKNEMWGIKTDGKN